MVIDSGVLIELLSIRSQALRQEPLSSAMAFARTVGRARSMTCIVYRHNVHTAQIARIAEVDSSLRQACRHLLLLRYPQGHRPCCATIAVLSRGMAAAKMTGQAHSSPSTVLRLNAA